MPTKAAKRSTAKKPAKKAAAKKSATKLQRDPRTERLVIEAVNALRDNPAKYKELRNSLDKAKSDKERAKHLLNYAVSDRELASLLPGRSTGGEAAIITWTTVTVTTVTFAEAPFEQRS
jgi:hypothetical protein